MEKKARKNTIRVVERGKTDFPKSQNWETSTQIDVCNKILKTWSKLFGVEEVTSLLQASNFKFDPEKVELTESNSGENLIDKLFFFVYSKKGTVWLSAVEKYAINLLKEKGLQASAVFESAIYGAEKKIDKLTEASLNLLENREDSIEVIKKEKKRTAILTEASLNLLEMKEKSEENLKKAIDQLTVDPRTGLGNQLFFEKFIHNVFLDNFENNTAWSLCYFHMDYQEELLYEFGEVKGNESLATATTILKSVSPTNYNIFKLDGDLFAVYMPETKIEKAKEIAEEIRLSFEDSEAFIRKMTVSIGGISNEDFKEEDLNNRQVVSNILRAVRMRVNHARQAGMNQASYESEIDPLKSLTGNILLVDSDRVNLDILKNNFRNNGFGVVAVENGELAYKAVELQPIDLIISEINIPMLDGFSFRQKLMKTSKYKNIPFIILSHQKNNEDISRAFSLGISHYLKKPYYISELLGIAKGFL